MINTQPISKLTLNRCQIKSPALRRNTPVPFRRIKTKLAINNSGAYYFQVQTKRGGTV